MKKYTILTMLLFVMFALHAQNLIEIEIEECGETEIKTNICADYENGRYDYAIIVINTNISGLEFRITNVKENPIKSEIWERLQGRYILCVEPMTSHTRYLVEVTSKSKEYKTEVFVIQNVKPYDKRFWCISPKENNVEVTVFDNYGRPLDNCRLDVQGMPTEYTNSEGFHAIKLFNTTETTLVISHGLYDDKIEKIVHPGDKLTVSLKNQKAPGSSSTSPQTPKDSKVQFIIGISNGIVAGEIGGVYGELKIGRTSGFALEGGFGIPKNGAMRWSGGMKGYVHHVYLSGHYGTTRDIPKNNNPFEMDDKGNFVLAGSRKVGAYGVSVLCGYDRTIRWFHFTAGLGTTIPTENTRLLFAWNVGIGISITDLFK